MSGPNESDGRAERPAEGASVLAGLPRTRPQRATRRRAASRRSGEAENAQLTKMAAAESAAAAQPAKASAKPVKPRAKATGSPKARQAKRPRAGVRNVEPVPRQGFECEGDRASGPVSPPGGIELVASAAELFGELAKAGVISGERLLRDVLSRLPGS